MSLKPIPVCSSCNRGTEKSISCTKCFRMCCTICFNLQIDLAEALTEDRLCPKCTGYIAIKPVPMDQPCSGATERNEELCELHAKPHKLFCLNCSVCICGECLSEKQHEMHHVNNLLVVYQEELAEVELKLADAEKQLASASVYERNLEKLENEESSIVTAVLNMKRKAISGLSSLTAKRKRILESKVNFYAEKRQRLSKLRETVKHLKAKDLLTKRATIDRQCEDITTGCTAKCDLQPVDDFKCDLVPAYTFANFTCPGLPTATSYLLFRIYSAYEVTWDITVSKSLTALQVKLNPTDFGILKFVHKLMVIIPHRDSTKEIRKTFDLEGAIHTFEIAPMSLLMEHGFFDKGGNIVLRIGVRPLDALVEKRLLDYNCGKLKNEISSLKGERSTLKMQLTNAHDGHKAETTTLKGDNAKLQLQISSLEKQLQSVTSSFDYKAENSTLKCDNAMLKLQISSLEMQLTSVTSSYDYNYCTSHLKLPLAALNTGFQQPSNSLVDEDGRWWNLNVYPPLYGKTPAQVGAYITLIKGSPTKCNIFIELKHTDAQKSVVRMGSNYFNEFGSTGWNDFIAWTELGDVGFHAGGNLSFRYGVKPLAN